MNYPDRELVERLLKGQKVGEEDETDCMACGKPLHAGEDVTVGVEYVADVVNAERTNCRSCDNKELDGDIAHASLGSLDPKKPEKTTALVLTEPTLRRRTNGNGREIR